MADIKTLTDLKTEALGILVGLDPSQAPHVEDMETIGMYVDPLIAQLAADEIVYIGDTEEIPVEWFLPIARLLANVAGPRFGVAINPQARQDDERTLRRLTGGKATYEVMRSEYY